MRFRKLFLSILLPAVILTVAWSFHTIYRSVRSISIAAQARFGQDYAASLIQLVQSDEFSFAERNRAIWALGQLGDQRALPVLEELNRQVLDQPGPGSLSQGLSKYNIEKSIRQIKSDFLATRWMYRFL